MGRRNMIVVLAILLIVFPVNVDANSDRYEVVCKLSGEDITLYAKKTNDLYQGFKIDFKGTIYSKPYWISVSHNPTYAPQIFYEDINKDNKRELIIILNEGYGTGVLQEKVHVFDVKNNHLSEQIVDNPLAIIYKNVETNLTADIAKIKVEGKVKEVDISPLNNLYKDIAYGAIIDYEVKEQQLMADISVHVSPTGYIGEIEITYEYRDKMYQAKSIEIQAY